MDKKTIFSEIAEKAPLLFWFEWAQNAGMFIESCGRAVTKCAPHCPATLEMIKGELLHCQTKIEDYLELLEFYQNYKKEQGDE